MEDAKSYKTEEAERAATPAPGLLERLVVQAADHSTVGSQPRQPGLADIALSPRLAATAVVFCCTTEGFISPFNFPLSGIPTPHWKEHMVLQLH